MKNSWFTHKQLTNRVWGIGEFQHFEKVISYLILGNKEALLFDTGLGIANIRNVVNHITNKPVFVLNSHHHYDHIGGNSLFDFHIRTPQDYSVFRMDPFLFINILTPGHSKDSLCLYERSNGYLFTGDTMYPGPIYLHLPESDIGEYKKSIHKISELSYVQHIFPGHNSFTCALNTPFLIMQGLEKKHLAKKVFITQDTSLLLK